MLSDKQLERFSLPDKVSTILAKAENETFSDLFIKGPLAVVATSLGLFQSGESIDMRTVDTVITLQKILLPKNP